MNKISLSILCLLAAVALNAQDFVINGYFNKSGDVNGEWTEIIVLKDGADLSGHHLVDNSLDGDWQGGVTFKSSSDLWKDMRRGTIIVVQHSTVEYDIIREDGYIDIAKTNFTHLDQYYDQIAPSEWYSGSLSINQTRDMIQLRNPAGQNVHTMGNVASNSAHFDGVSGPKIGYSGSLNQFSAIVADPGASVGDYNTGRLTNVSLINGGNGLKGIANSASNSSFVRSLRQPTWQNPEITFARSGNFLNLSWNSAERDLDNTQGYLVMRSIPGGIEAPVDGQIYNVGQQIGNSMIVAINQSSSRTFRQLISELDCDREYEFAVFAYRFAKDDENKDSNPANGRGRSYNESNFASNRISLEQPPIPIVEDLIDGKVIICNLDSVELRVENAATGFTYQWFRDDRNTPQNGETNSTYIASQAGKYLVSITNQSGCASYSELFEVEVVPQATIELYFTENQTDEVVRDSVLFICPGDEIDLTALSGGEIEWYKDNSIQSNGANFIISQTGIYFAVNNQGACVDSTPKIEVRLNNTDLVFSRTTVDFGDLTGVGIENLNITNNGSNSVTITTDNVVDIPADVQLYPGLPWTLDPGDVFGIEIRFSTIRSGSFLEFIEFDFGCDKLSTIELTGNRVDGVLVSEPIFIDSTIVDCGVKKLHSLSIEIKNDTPIDLQLPQLPASRILTSIPEIGISSGLTETFVGNSQQSIMLTFTPNANGVFEDILRIPFSEGDNLWDTLSIPVRIDYKYFNLSYDPNFVIDDVGECESEISFSVTFENLGFDFSEVELVDNDTRLSFDNYSSELSQNSIWNLEMTLQNPGTETLEIKFYDRSCQDTISLLLDISKQGYNYAFESELEIDTIVLCDDNSYSYETEIIISGTGDDPVTITEITHESGVSVGISSGQQLQQGANTFEIEFNELSQGRYQGSLALVVDPCGRLITFTYDFNVEDLRLQYSITSLEYDQVELGSAETQTVQVSNISSRDVQVSIRDEALLPSQVTVTSSSLSLPITISANSTAPIEITYKPEEYFESILTNLELESFSECALIQGIDLSLTSARQNSAELTFYAEQWYNESGLNPGPGDITTIPVYLRSDDLELFKESQTNDLELIFDLNQTLFELQTIKSSQPEVFVNEFAYLTQDKQLKVLLDIEDIDLLTEGEAFQLKGQSTIGDGLYSVFVQDTTTSKTFGNNVLVEFGTEPITHRLDSTCDYSYRKIQFANKLQTSLLLNNYGEDFIEIFSSIATEARIRVADVTGRIVFADSYLIREKLEIPISTILQSGQFFVVITDGITTNTYNYSNFR